MSRVLFNKKEKEKENKKKKKKKKKIINKIFPRGLFLKGLFFPEGFF